jgi:hypothetical protein
VSRGDGRGIGVGWNGVGLRGWRGMDVGLRGMVMDVCAHGKSIPHNTHKQTRLLLGDVGVKGGIALFDVQVLLGQQQAAAGGSGDGKPQLLVIDLTVRCVVGEGGGGGDGG